MWQKGSKICTQKKKKSYPHMHISKLKVLVEGLKAGWCCERAEPFSSRWSSV